VAMSPFGYPKEKNSLYEKAVKAFAGSRNRVEMDKIILREKWGER